MLILTVLAEESTAYRIGYVLGLVLPFAVIGGLIWFFVRRSGRKQGATFTTGQQPGLGHAQASPAHGQGQPASGQEPQQPHWDAQRQQYYQSVWDPQAGTWVAWYWDETRQQYLPPQQAQPQG